MEVKPLKEEEKEKILESINQLECFPSSIRLFSELHQTCLDLVQTRGQHVQALQTSRAYKPDSGRKDGLSFFYVQHPRAKDSLSIIYTLRDEKKEIVLARERGYQTRKKEKSLDMVGKLLRGLTPSQFFRGSITYEARELFQFLIGENSRDLIREHQY